MFSDDDATLMDTAMDAADTRLQGFSPSEVPVDRALLIAAEDGEALVMCKTLTPATPSGKIELFCQDLEDRFSYGVPRYEALARDLPFTIISPSSSKRTNTTFGGCAESQGIEILEINPADTAARGISEGDEVRVWNDRGEVHLTARLTDAVRAGVLYSPKGTWLATSSTGQTVNALIPSDIRTDIEDGACYNETFVDVARVA
jgi:anaerobic selenocysteine-containing dehydrogenase